MPDKALASIWIDGKAVETEQAKVSVFDRGLQYGDGFFTTALIREGRLLNWPAHLRRIEQCSQRLGFSPVDQDFLQTVLIRQFRSLDDEFRGQQLVCKLLFTRGTGGRGYQPPENNQTTLISTFALAPAEQKTPIEVAVSPVVLELASELAGLKHLNRLHNVLARQALQQQTSSASEGIMFNPLGDAICGIQSNLFLLKGSQLITPFLNFSGVEGTSRFVLSRVCEQAGLQWQEAKLTLDDILQADGIFFTNAVRGIMPVKKLDLGAWPQLAGKLSELGLSDIPDGEIPSNLCYDGEQFAVLQKTYYQVLYHHSLPLN